jgi:hypothetical protein
MPRPRATILGERFGRLLVVGYGTEASGRTVALARCDCGEISRVRPVNLRSGNSLSCGCLHREISHLPPADRALWPAAIAVAWKPQEVLHAA